MSPPPPSTPFPGERPLVGEADGSAAKRHETLTPPEWIEREGPRSAASLALERIEQDAPVARRTGPAAELAPLRARLARARVERDLDAERAAAIALSHALGARGSELDTATRLARRALVLGEDSALREELSGWFAGLGEPALAAATLRVVVDELSGPALFRTLVRIAVLLARSGDAPGAAEALEQATQDDPSEPSAFELLGAISAWAPDAVTEERAARAYLEAAGRHEARNERGAAFEDLFRAFEACPASHAAAERLAAGLAARERSGAADEILREHARALGDHSRPVHLERVRAALSENDLPRALGAALDARLEAHVDTEAALAAIEPGRGARPGSFDEICLRAGLHELVAARLEIACDALSGPARAYVRLGLGHLYAGALSSGERAADAWIDALVADPANEQCKALLRAHAATTRDQTPLVEALVRVGASESPERVACLRELIVLAEQRLGDPGLALWAVRRAMDTGEADPELSASGARLAARARLQDEALASARAALDSAVGKDRIEPLRRAAAILRGRPGEIDAYVAVLVELTGLLPEERGFQHALERVLWRERRFDELAAVLRSFVSDAGSAMEVERGRIALSALRRRRGDDAGAARELEPLLSGGSYPAACSHALVLGSRLGDESMRAQALQSIAAQLPHALRAVVGSVAADAWLSAGELERARATAEQACNADPSLARPIATRAHVALLRGDRDAAAVLERAMGVVVPRAALCRALSEAYAEAGEMNLAIAWTQRRLGLRPGDPDAVRALLVGVTTSADPGRLGDVLGWLLSQPQPLTELVEPLTAALRRLAALDPSRGAALARRALDVLGPRSELLRETVLAIADRIGERGLGIALVERWLAAGAPGAKRSELLLDLARRRKAAGDTDGAARALHRAIEDGADAATVLAELDVALPPRGSDGEISLLEARAEALSASADADLAGVARIWREVGAARWDLGSDPDGALAAWQRAAALDPERGMTRLARDLVAFAGDESAMKRLVELASREEDREKAAELLAITATIALSAEKPREALRIAARALDLDPSRADVLAVAERCAEPEDVALLESIYERLGDATLGIYGERAVHYRAARQFERRGDSERALKHALRAFEAVPAEGVTFVLIARLAERVGETNDIVRTLERVASRVGDPNQRANWLRHAALFAGPSDEGKRERVEVLLRALSVRPDAETLDGLGRALFELAELSPNDREIVELRFERALDGVFAQCDGPEGARFACHAAFVALKTFDSARIALAALERAVDFDGDIDEFGELMPEVRRIAKAPEARRLLTKLVELTTKKFANVGRALVELGAALAHELHDWRAVALLLVFAAQRDPNDKELVKRADEAARASGDAELVKSLLDAVPPRERVAKLLELAQNAESMGDLRCAATHVEQALATEGIDEAERLGVFARLRELYGRSGRRDALEELLGAEIERAGGDMRRVVTLTRDLAALLAARGNSERALEILVALTESFPDDERVAIDVVELAKQTGDRNRQADALGLLANITTEKKTKVGYLRELAPLLEELGARVAAHARYNELLRLDPEDTSAIAALEREAEQRGDYERLVELMARRAALSSSADEVRRIHLRRAVVLEQRLGRPDEAKSELEAVLSATGDNMSVLRVLADLNERLGDPVRAAPLWLRASALTRDREEASDLASRACESFLSAGDADAARAVIDQLQPWQKTRKLLSLRVEIERRGQNAQALAIALDELASISVDAPEARAELLVEAACASLAAEDRRAALLRAQRAARVAPTSAGPQLCARYIEYLERGAGTVEEARVTAAELRAIEGSLTAEQSELYTFLIAEALDVALGNKSGIRELIRAHSEVGSRPLVALGIAERLSTGGEALRALPLFEAALAGDLRGLRARGNVALTAARAAQSVGQLERALGYLDIAATDAASRAEALALQAELRVALHPDTEADRRAEEQKAPDYDIEETGTMYRSVPPPDSAAPMALVRPARSQPEQPPEPPRSPEPPQPSRPAPPPPPAPGRSSDRPARASERPLPIIEIGPTSGSAELSRRMSPLGVTAASGMESMLLGALSKGSIEAGKELIQQLENRSDRTRDLVTVCRRVATLLPGDTWTLDKLYEAALADRNVVYARAVEHVLRAFTQHAAQIDPPPLVDQEEQPESVRALLFRGALGPTAEALGHVWEGAEHVFRRDPSTYGVTGMERIPLGSPTPVGRVYSSAARLLGLARTPLYQRRSAGAVTLSVALVSPPSLILSGEVRQETPELRFHMGAMLAAAMPELVLLFGSPESQTRAVLKGLALAFGPPQSGPSSVQSIATLAEVLWESVPARAQRRLRELCDDPRVFDYETALTEGRAAIHRAGLFVSGDLRVAIRETCIDERISMRALEEPNGLAALCASSPALGDLVRLATSPEYAEARWQPGRSGTRHPTGSFATF